MQAVTFHFNPNLKPDLIFDSFCYEPKGIYEKRMGNLYLVGLLRNVLPHNLHFLDKLAKVIQKEYYRAITRKPEKALKEGLKEANEFLEQIAKKGDVSWLGNLSFAALSLTPHQKLASFELNFTKAGELKIFFFRGKKIIALDRKLKFEEIAPWPLRIFGNIASGKLIEGDLLLVATKEISNFLEEENLLAEIGNIWPPEEKKLKEIFNKKFTQASSSGAQVSSSLEKEILKISGVCLFIFLTREVILGKKQVISGNFYPKEFSWKEVFNPLLNIFKELIKKSCLLLLSFLRQVKLGKLPKLHKNLILISALVFFLALGFLLAQLQEKRELKERQAVLAEIQQKVNQAESSLILKTPQAKKTANLLLQKSLREITQLAKVVTHLPRDFQNQVFSLKEEISQTLFELNRLEIIEEPKLFFDFQEKNFFPQKMVFFDDKLYFFSLYSPNLFKVDQNAQGKIIEIDQKFDLATLFNEAILFFSQPNQIRVLKENQFKQFFLEEPYPGFHFDDFASFWGHLYFLDKNSGEIVKYPYFGNFQWGSPRLWLAPKEKRVVKAHSLAVDGSIWLLTPQQKEESRILRRYHRGRFQEEIVLKIFPEPQEFKGIFTSPGLPYLYLLEPAQKRIVILDKKGQIVKQFQSAKFDHLLDFAVSPDGRTIYLLNHLKIYKLLF